ncbi:MAG: GHKL domain-containing protein [Gammaproteobacteria bacterium]|nr:GHKL domain-containing protein [Gammaproteobacteria bacterium]
MNFKTARLSTRLLIASAIVLPVFLGFSAYMLDLAFRNSLISAEQNRLNGHIYLLLTAADLIDGRLQLPTQLTEPLFGQLNSGLYAVIYDLNSNEVWRSQSAAILDMQIKVNSPITPGAAEFAPVVIDNDEFYQFNFDVAYETDDITPKLYRFSVLHTQQGVRSELAAYRQQLWWLLGGLTLLLLVTQVWIMRWGLLPLKTVAEDLTAVEQGEKELLQDNYPYEIRSVTDNLNRVLKTERIQRERYRNTLADLAHSLKTPLAVLRGALDQPEDKLRMLLDDQITRMNQIVSHQLQRAVINNQSQPGQRTDLLKLVKRVSDALDKVYRDKAIVLQITAEPDCFFYGAESDLMEVLGNILDNAYKYGNKQVQVKITNKKDILKICIADDGSGIDDSKKEQILQRGARADTAQPGYGIGLSVAVDILSSYKGSLSVNKSKLGGTEFIIILPSTIS